MAYRIEPDEEVLARFIARAPRGPAIGERQVRRAEEALGPLPASFRRLYLACGNGGFLPGVRPLIVDEEPTDAYGGQSIVHAFGEDAKGEDEYRWPPGLLRFYDWGCGIESCVDVASPRLRVVRFDPNIQGDEDDVAPEPDDAYPVSVVGAFQLPTFQIESDSLADWLECWMEGHDGLKLMRMEPQARRRQR